MVEMWLIISLFILLLIFNSPSLNKTSYKDRIHHKNGRIKLLLIRLLLKLADGIV